MGPADILAMAEQRATEAEQAGNIPLAKLLRAQIEKQRAPQAEPSNRVRVAPGAIPLLPSSRSLSKPQEHPAAINGQVDLLRHVSLLHSSLLDLQAKHGELLRQHTQLHQSHAEMRAVLTVLHNQATASNGMLQQLHSELYSSSKG